MIASRVVARRRETWTTSIRDLRTGLIIWLAEQKKKKKEERKKSKTKKRKTEQSPREFAFLGEP